MTDAFGLHGKVALITGGGSERGIGRAIGVAFAGAGCAVALADLDAAGARRNAEALAAGRPGAIGVEVDVTSPKSVRTAVAAVVRELGPVDILVNSAGITSPTPLLEITIEEYDRIMAINLRGGFICLQAVAPGMKERGWGRIIWLSSVAGKQGGGVFGTTHYAATKAGVIGLCQGAARELGRWGITSNAIAPGMVLTGLLARTASPEVEREVDERNRSLVPAGRSAVPEDVAHAALFLASPGASYVNGEIMDVNGGVYFD